ncbi:hypothetical protein ElyMa_000476100 [Elysia marginata]|uniref:DOMON domain-containing protein n=1 Tax=Elysia marginata TaxID=1093978 RepID=A0AAV4FS91_9GAST|nr:hypothetical protein ElyMa_000476100 [Elysia marginata]
MKVPVSVVAVCVLLGLQAVLGQVCQPAQSESVYYLTNSMEDLYVATDYDRGLTLVVYGDNADGDHWFLVDTESRNTYYNTPEDGCVYARFSPKQNKRSGDVDFYYMQRPGFNWLVGMKPVPDTRYFYKHFSRINSYGVYQVPDESSYGVVYSYSVGLSDPTVLDKDLSACVEGPHNQF